MDTDEARAKLSEVSAPDSLRVAMKNDGKKVPLASYKSPVEKEKLESTPGITTTVPADTHCVKAVALLGEKVNPVVSRHNHCGREPRSCNVLHDSCNTSTKISCKNSDLPNEVDRKSKTRATDEKTTSEKSSAESSWSE